MSGNPDQPPVVPGKTRETYYPPPPPGGPPHADQQQQQPIYEASNSDLPPAYNTGAQQQAPPEKAPLPQQTAAGEQSFPPPPPGPPPSHQQQQPYAPSRTDTTEANAFYKNSDIYEENPPVPGPRPTGAGAGVATGVGAAGAGAGTAGAIPSYDPAHPHFAPPPGQQQQQQQYSQQQYNQPPAGSNAFATGASSTHPTGAAPAQAHGQDGSHRSWGSLLTEMGHKAAAPINALANKLGSQSFLPTSLDKESEKAAQILRSFCKEGISSDAAAVNVNPDEKEKIDNDGSLTPTKQKQRKERRAIVKIPSKVINKAQGLAIFTTARMGFNLSGATGSGVLIARLPDGSWSPPSGIQVHAVGAGFMIGVDIYDCVCVINSREALAAFMSTRVSLGPDVAVTAGPWGAGGMVDFGGAFQSNDERKAAEAQKAQLEQQQKEDHVHEKPALGPDGAPVADANLKPEKPQNKRSSSVSLKPVYTYVKSRGFYAGVQVDGTIITERKDANASFYGNRVSVEQILRGEVPPGGAWSAGVRPLFDALRVAETQQALPDANMPAPPPAGVHPQPAAAPGQVPAQAAAQQHHMSGAGPSHGGEALPGYQDDGVHRPGVGDNKTQYA